MADYLDLGKMAAQAMEAFADYDGPIDYSENKAVFRITKRIDYQLNRVKEHLLLSDIDLGKLHRPEEED